MNYLALHGFTQRGSMWAEVAARVGGEWAAPDLPGHGGRPACSWDEAVSWVSGLLAGAAKPACLVGYSMGGRLALAAALAHPHPLPGLVLISATPGVEEAGARAQRRAEDLALAAHIEEAGTEAFVGEWLRRPLFAGLAARPPEWRAADRAARLGNQAGGLGGALRLLGQGAQPYLGDRLGDLEMPVLLLAGAQDDRYAGLARLMGERMRRATVREVPGAGHAVVGEKPGEVAAAIQAWAGSR